MDAYGESEQLVGFYTMFEDHLKMPFDVEILGVTAAVERIDMMNSEYCNANKSTGRCH